MTADANRPIRQRLVIRGTVDSETFLPWIRRHAEKLGLSGRVSDRSDNRIELDLTGPPDLIDAMEMGCSLGPKEVLIDRVDRVSLDQPASTESLTPGIAPT